MHMHSTSIVLTRCDPGMQELQTKEIKNARLAMVAFVGFIVAAQATGQVMHTPTSCSLVVCHGITMNKCPVVCSLLTGLGLPLQLRCMLSDHPGSGDVKWFPE